MQKWINQFILTIVFFCYEFRFLCQINLTFIRFFKITCHITQLWSNVFKVFVSSNEPEIFFGLYLLKVVNKIANQNTNYQVTPFRINNNFLESTCSLNDGCFSAIINASIFCLIRLFDGAGRRTLKLNEWVILFFRYFVGYKYFYKPSCSCHLISTILTVSPMYDTWQEESAKLRALRALVSYVPFALRTLVPHVLSCLTFPLSLKSCVLHLFCACFPDASLEIF